MVNSQTTVMLVNPNRQPRPKSYHCGMNLWWTTAREQCARCANCLIQDDPKQDKPGTIMRCTALPVRGRGKFLYCIEARDGGKCGHDATLFKAKNEAS